MKSPLSFVLFNGDLVHDTPALLHEVKKKYDALKMPYFVCRGNHDRCSAEHWEAVWNRPLNYSFDIGDTGFLVLDTANEKGSYVCPDIRWTRHELDRLASGKELFAFMHITPRKWTRHGIHCPKLVRMFSRQNNLRAVFQGHDHDHDYVMREACKPYFFDGHLGGNWGTTYRGYRMVEVLHNGSAITYQVNPFEHLTVNSTGC
jgi:3',5'-cyclic-AMP phosphodiesterase